MWRQFWLLLIGIAAASSTSNWVQIDQAQELKCPMPEDGEKLSSCAWRKPGNGENEEENRSFYGHFKNDPRLSILKNDAECTIQIKNVKAEDEGDWECKLNYEKSDGATDSKTTIIELRLTNITNDNPTVEKVVVNENTTETNFRCKFESNPLPNFSWFIDDVKLEDATEMSEDKLTQTLIYGKPREGHSNKTLKCVVDLKEHGLNETFEETIVLDFPENAELVPNKPTKAQENPTESMSTSTITVIVVIVIIVLFGSIAFVSYKYGCNRAPKKSDDVDAETGTSDSLPMKESTTDTEKTDDNETEKADSTKDEKEKLTETAANRNLGDRIASFFRINKSFNMDDEKTDAEKKTNENEVKEVVVNGAGDNKEVNGDLDKPDCNVHDKTDETVALEEKKVNGGNKILAFFGKMFKPRSDVVADKSATEGQTVIKMPEEGQEDLEQDQNNADETIPLANDELEPEDKPEPVVDEQDNKTEPAEDQDEKKEPTPNTSF